MKDLSRRQFVGAGLAAGFGVPVLFGDEPKKVDPLDKIRVAVIGCGGMGRADMKGFIRLPEFEIIGLCDPDKGRIKEAIDDLQKAGRPTDKLQTEQDFRRILDNRDVQAVIIGTPDHWHAYILIAACAKEKDVYCEKPLSHNVVEGRKMVEAARRFKRVVQIGTQQRSGTHFQSAVAFVHSGKLGHIHTCRTWITNQTGPEGDGKPADGEPPPGVDYDLWLGPAPKRPFNRNRFHYNFRWFWDYGSGLCNDWGVHLNDIILWGMKVQAPLSVSAVGGRFEIQDNSDTPDTLDIYFEYPGFTHVYTVRRGKMLAGYHKKGHGMEFAGNDGTLTLDRGGWFVTPAGEKLKPETSGGSEQHFTHVQNFLACVRKREMKTASEIEEMHRATTTCHLANIAYRVQRRIYWDPVNERCYRGYDPATKKFLWEDAEANAYLLREPRKPWSLEV